MLERYRRYRSYGHNRLVAGMYAIPLGFEIAIGALVGWFIGGQFFG